MEDPIVNIDPDFGEICQRSDTRLMTEDGTVFHVNSELLSRHSKFFNCLFLIGEEAGQSTVIRNIKPDIFQIILTYMSTGEKLLTTENVMDLSVASDFLMIESLLDECRKFVLQNIKVENVVSFFLTVKRIKGLDMEHQFRRYLVLCFEKAVMHSMDEACCLPYGELKYILSQRSLNVSCERTIWLVIEAWVQKDPVKRHSFVPGLLRCLSIHEMDYDLALDLLASIIINNPFYKDVVDGNVDKWISGIKIRLQTVILFRNELPFISDVRLPRFLHFVVKYFQERDGAELFISYDDSLDLCRKVGEISLKSLRLLASGHLVYFLNYLGDGEYEFHGLYYDLLRKELKPMKIPIYGVYVVGEVGGRVYALEKNGKAISYYVQATDEWRDMGETRHRVDGYMRLEKALNLNGLLYVIGDFGIDGHLMQVYDSYYNKWCRGHPPTVQRQLYWAGAGVYQGKIFLVAGTNIEDEDDDEDDEDEDEEDDEEQMKFFSKAVEVYDPKSKEWTIYPELPFRYYDVSLSVVKDRLYVYQDPQCPVTYWDGSGEWKIAENPSLLFQHEFCAIKDMFVVGTIMRRNKEEDLTVWLDTGLQKDLF